MQLGLILSIMMHAALLGWAYVTMSKTAELPSSVPEPIAIAMITPSELLRLKQGDVNAKELLSKAKDNEPKPDLSKKEAEKPKPLTASEPPAEEKTVEPQKSDAAKAEPEKSDPIAEKLAHLPEPEKGLEEMKRLEEQKKAEEEAKKKADEEARKKAEEKKKAEEARKKKLAEEKRKAEEARKKSESDRLSALLDKDPTKRGAPQSSSDPDAETDHTGPAAGADKGTDTVLAAREQDLLLGRINAQLMPCSKLPGGGGGIDTPVVTVRWRMREDGSLDSEPEVLNPQDSPLFRIAADASVNAVKNCSPLNLPPDMYKHWSSITWDFDWPRILGLR
jgi:colicin import membrane protein